MKIKKIVISYPFLILTLLAGCAKEQTTRIETSSNSTSQTTIASDEVTINNELDQAIDDAITVLCNHHATVSNAFVDSLSPAVLEITYNGVEKNGTKSRLGADSIHQNLVNGHVVQWGKPGSSANITFRDVNSAAGYEVTFTKGNTSIWLGGTITLTYISGPAIQSITPTDSLQVKVTGTLTYTFNDNAATVQYNPLSLYQIRYYTNSGSLLYATTMGDTAINNFQNVCDWGTDRYQNTYYSSITNHVIQNISDYTLSYNPLSGVKNIENISEPILCTYGVDQHGNVISSGAPYGFSIGWINNGGAAQAVIPYYY